MVKNAQKLYYPIKQAIESVLPICDEFIVALGDCDEDDKTLQEIQSINSEKIKIVNTVWDTEKYKTGTVNAQQTNVAKSYATGDWVLYLQADEVIHEKYLPIIKQNCEKYLDAKEVEGFLFKYLHFYGDYNHYVNAHGWYKNEIRLVRNHKDIYSFASAQSFRYIPNFDGISYRDRKNSRSLNVIKLDVFVYHYGWVRPPEYMQSKNKALATIHHGKKSAEEDYNKQSKKFDYGDLSKLKKFKGSHPKVLETWIEKFNWENELNYGDKPKPNRYLLKHERTKYQIISFFENLFGINLGYKNWNILKPKKVLKIKKSL